MDRQSADRLAPSSVQASVAPTRKSSAVVDIDFPTGVLINLMNTTPGLHTGSGSMRMVASAVCPARNTYRGSVNPSVMVSL